MPRGCKVVKTKTIQEQITDVDTEIEDYKQKISDAREKRKVLMERKEKEELAVLYEAVKASGKTPEEFLKALQEQQKQGE